MDYKEGYIITVDKKRATRRWFNGKGHDRKLLSPLPAPYVWKFVGYDDESFSFMVVDRGKELKEK
jgi:hypothetical protein